MWQFACSMCGGHRGQDHAQRYCQAKILALTSALNEDEPSLAQADAGDTHIRVTVCGQYKS